MVEGTIGPIELDHTELYDSNTLQIDGHEEFTIICTNSQARQIMGLASINNTKETTNSITTLTHDNPWGIVWLDTSNTLTDNDDIVHRGWYHIIGAEPTTDLGADYVHLAVLVEKISPYEHEYLEMDYTPGVNDDTEIELNYTDQTLTYSLNDAFTTLSSTNWDSAVASGLTGQAVTPISGKLNFIGASSSEGTYGSDMIVSKTSYPSPFTVETTLEWVATPGAADNQHGLEFYICDGVPTTYTDAYNIVSRDHIRVRVMSSNMKAYYTVEKYALGSKTILVRETSLATAEKTPKFKLELSGSSGTSTVTVYVDKTAGGTWTKVFGPANTGVNFTSGRYLAYAFINASDASATMRTDYCQVYGYLESNPSNIVPLPATTPTVTPDFYRVSAEGSIPCYVTPTTELYFWNDAENIYDGCVKGYNSNYPDSTARLITWKDEVLDPDKFTVNNGLVKLTTSSTATTPVLFSAYASPAGWTDLQVLNPGTIRLVKPLLLSPDRQTYQINDTKWTISRGKQHIKVEHPNTTIGYTPVSNYYHDGVTTTPAELLTTNQIGVETNTVGFSGAIGTETLTSSTDQAKAGSKSLKVVTAATANSGDLITGTTSVTPGLDYIYEGYVYAVTPSKTMTVALYDDGYNGLSSSTFTSTPLWQYIRLKGTLGAGDTQVIPSVFNNSAEAVTFHIDENHLFTPLLDTDIVMESQYYTNLYNTNDTSACFQIIKTDPTTIKSDSIPAADITGIGWYDPTETTPSYNHYANIAREFMVQPHTAINIRQV